jgi:chemotaxis protein MotB
MSRRYRTAQNNASQNPVHHVWPGFVDALSALLTVVLFAFMIFVVSYVCTRQMMQGKVSSLALLQNKAHHLEKDLLEKMDALDRLGALYGSIKARLLSTEEAMRIAQNENIQLQRQSLVLAERTQQQDVQLTELSKKLEAALLKEIQALSDSRSAFFGELKKALQDRKEIRIVGDRFIFSSEILFDLGSADINAKGKQELTAFALALNDIMARIPDNVSWVLRVDGHTDLTPVRAQGRFKNNLELSIARAVAVVDFLISQGFPQQRLVTAGFGEFRPLTPGQPSPKDRRIELMFDQGY